ncbi:MAG: 5-deoxy-glucuronate isomerase [Anaerolineales bacterium]|nr:5-deoxy-glucuronate isomerase [Anaerolineales bacterium]
MKPARPYTAEQLIVHPAAHPPEPEVIVAVTPEAAGWDTLAFQARRLAPGHSWRWATGQHELALVMLSGRAAVESNRGRWPALGERPNVFAGKPHALYLPPATEFTVTAATAAEFAVAWVSAPAAHAPRLITPADVAVEIRGGDHATRQINQIIPPGFPCGRLVVVEVYTPGGNWSSYPPHKHDVHTIDQHGTVTEADLDEIYFYKLDRPEGYALQRVYTGPDSPLQRAGYPIDAVVVARDNDAVLIPEGYHPVSAPVGYTVYYLNILAGSAHSLAASDDPRYAWVKHSYHTRDPRVPVYPLD